MNPLLALIGAAGGLMAAVGAVIESPEAQAAGTAMNSGILLWMSARLTRLETRFDAREGRK